jgi:hypothetical protein
MVKSLCVKTHINPTDFVPGPQKLKLRADAKTGAKMHQDGAEDQISRSKSDMPQF